MSIMLFFATPAAPEPAFLILTVREAARQRARRLARARRAEQTAARLIASAR